MTLLPHPKGLYGTSTRKEIFNNHLFLSPFPIATLIVTPRVEETLLLSRSAAVFAASDSFLLRPIGVFEVLA